MELFYFQSEMHQILIASASFKLALESFSQTLGELYGKTLKGWEVGSDSLTVHWQEEGEPGNMKDVYYFSTLPQNTAVWFTNIEQEQPTFIVPGQPQEALKFWKESARSDSKLGKRFIQ